MRKRVGTQRVLAYAALVRKEQEEWKEKWMRKRNLRGGNGEWEEGGREGGGRGGGCWRKVGRRKGRKEWEGEVERDGGELCRKIRKMG